MSKFIHDRILMHDESKAHLLETPNDSKGWNSIFANLIMQSVNAKHQTEERICEICKTSVDFTSSDSIVFGKFSVIPNLCEECRKKAVNEHEEVERQFVWHSKIGKCAGYQNKSTLFRGIAPLSEDVKKIYDHQEKYFEYIFDFLGGNEKRGAFVSGNSGTGKTFLTKMLHNELCSQYKDSCFIKSVDLALALRRSAMDSESNMINEFRFVDTLIIDDFGTQKNTEYLREVIFSIFDYRYDNKKKTIITSNMTELDIKEEDPRFESRLSDQEFMKKIKMVGSDIRQFGLSQFL